MGSPPSDCLPGCTPEAPTDPEALARALLTAAATAPDPRPLLEAAAALLAGRPVVALPRLAGGA